MNTQVNLQLIEILEKTVSPDKNELLSAKNFLEQAAETNLCEFLVALSDILVTTTNSAVARMAAGLQLKNHLTSKEEKMNIKYQERWLQFPNEIREYIKENILKTLGTENTRPSCAAQCVAYVAVAELPCGRWDMLINTLVSKVVTEGSSEMLRESALEAMGYICQEIQQGVLENQSNQILTAIIHGMRKQEPSRNVRLAATTALLNSLEFTKANFEKDSERNFIMEVVCEATQSNDIQISVAALQCLVKILSLYYHYMEPYMGQALFPITLEAMKSDNDDVALQGIEFWSNVCDEEVGLAVECQEAIEAGRTPTRVSKHYARGALQFLMPVLIEKLTKQDECEAEDNWNPPKASSVCLILLSQCCEAEIIPFALPFINDNIESPNWRFRDAAVMTFGSIMGGLDNNDLKSLVEQALPTLIRLMYDPNMNVRDTTAWAFGRICDIIPEAVLNKLYLSTLLDCFFKGLKSEPRVAGNICWALIGLSEGAYEAAKNDKDDPPKTYCLSQYFDVIINNLLQTTDRVDGAQANLRASAYEALMEMIRNSPVDCYTTVQKTTMVILNRLNQILQMEAHLSNQSDRSQYNDIQSLLCATLQSVLRKVEPEDAPKISDTVMNAILTTFRTSSNKVGVVHEDAFVAISTLAELLGEKFLAYMNALKPYLYMGLKNFQEYQVCFAAVGLTGDICRALKDLILPYCDDIMAILCENIREPGLHQSVKPQILSTFGDMALAIGPEFVRYLAIVLDFLKHASLAQVDPTNYDMVEYFSNLRESVMEAYTGIIQGLKGTPDKPRAEIAHVEPYIGQIISFIKGIIQDNDAPDAVRAMAAGLIGDLCLAFGIQKCSFVDDDDIRSFLTQGKNSTCKRRRKLSNWAFEIIKSQREPIK